MLTDISQVKGDIILLFFVCLTQSPYRSGSQILNIIILSKHCKFTKKSILFTHCDVLIKSFIQNIQEAIDIANIILHTRGIDHMLDAQRGMVTGSGLPRLPLSHRNLR